jgi:phage/plasmid-associated DNA primase
MKGQYGGSWSIPDDQIDTFDNLYSQQIDANKELYMTECHMPNCGPIIIDFDFRFPIDTKDTKLTNKVITRITRNINKIIAKYLSEDNNFCCIVLKRPKPYIDYSRKDKKLKDGFHIQYPYLITPYEFQHQIRNEYLETTMKEDIKAILYVNELNDVYDKCVIESNNWCMYGSTKAGVEPYKEILRFDGENAPFKTTLDKIKLLSIRNKDLLKSKFKPEFEYFWTISKVPNKQLTLNTKSMTNKSSKKITIFNSEEEDNDINIDLSEDEDDADWFIMAKSKLESDEEDSIDEIEDEYEEAGEVNNGDCNNNINIETTIGIPESEILSILKKSPNYMKYKLYLKLFKCYKKSRYELYNDWRTVGMALMNVYGMDAFELFNYYSSKGDNYDGKDATLAKYKSFKTNYEAGYTVATIYSFAKIDNPKLYKKIMFQKNFSLEDDDIAKKIKELAGDRFIYKQVGDKVYDLYCFNGKYWIKSILPLRQYISNELYDYFFEQLTTVYANSKDYIRYRDKIRRLKNVTSKLLIIKAYEEVGLNEDIVFDDKYWLLGFRNMIYDLKEHQFRNYRYDDYIATIINYDWKSPTQEEINKVEQLFTTIMPVDDEKVLYKQILATGLEGRCLEHFVLLNGAGGNGKSLMDEFVTHALSPFAFVGNNSILFEKSKTGSNPEKANLHKKRIVFFREPPESCKFENSIIKELTGGGKISARGHHETCTEKDLHGTIIVECNKKPLFKEEPTDADARRIIDVYFRSTFTTDESLLSNEDHIYLANKDYKTKEFQDKHKFALLWILMEAYKGYEAAGFKLVLPEFIKQRTAEYLEQSCDILQWFVDHYQIVKDTKNTENVSQGCKLKNLKPYVQIKDIYSSFRCSDHWSNMSKGQRNKYKLACFIDYFRTNIRMKKYYRDRYDNKRNCLLEWKEWFEDEEEKNSNGNGNVNLKEDIENITLEEQ